MASARGLFFLASIVALFSTSAPAQIKLDRHNDMENLEFLAYALSQDLSSVPDPGIGDWFSRNFKALLPKIFELFKDPANIKKFINLTGILLKLQSNSLKSITRMKLRQGILFVQSSHFLLLLTNYLMNLEVSRPTSGSLKNCGKT